MFFIPKIAGRSADPRKYRGEAGPIYEKRNFPFDVNVLNLQPRRMIQSFADEVTEQIWKGVPVRRVPADLQRQALKRLGYLNASQKLEDLFQPPSNRFHALKGSGRYAIRVNLQWRITFTWTEAGPAEVLFEDYH